MPFVEIAGLTIHYDAVGNPAAPRGQCVLYVHGTGCNTRVWEPHMQAIAEAHTPVAIDLPGHGQSTGRGFRGAADYAAFVVELANVLGWERFVVAGHSLGGAVALSAAMYDADRLSGLLLIDTGARLRVGPAILRAAREAAETGRRPGSMERAWAFARSTPQEVVDTVTELTASTDPRVTYADWIADDSFDCLSRVQDIQVPTLALCGAEDRLTPVKYHRFLQETMPNCQLVVIPQAGHWVYREQPAAFNRAVRAFLDGLPGR